MTDWETCSLCGLVGPTTAIDVFLAKWREPDQHAGHEYDPIVRCRDAQACRDRYQLPGSGRQWPIEDRTVPTIPARIKRVGMTPELGAGATR